MVFSFRHLIYKYLQAEEICKLCNLVFTNEVCCEQHKGGRDHKAVAQARGWASIISTSITTWVTIRIWLSKIVQIRQHVWFMVFMFLQLNVEFVKNVSIIVAFSLKFTMERVKSGFRKIVLFLEKGKQLFWTWKRRKFDQVIEFLKKWSSAKNSQSDFSHKRKLDGNEEKEKKIPKTSV